MFEGRIQDSKDLLTFVIILIDVATIFVSARLINQCLQLFSWSWEFIESLDFNSAYILVGKSHLHRLLILLPYLFIKMFY